MIHFISNQPPIQDDLLDNPNSGTMSELLCWLEGKEVLGVDTETTGFDFLTKRVIMLQIGDDKDQWVIDTRGTDVSSLAYVFEDKNVVKIFHNAKFDLKHLRSSFGFVCENVYDTMLTEQVMYGGIPDYGFSLAALCKRYLGVELDKSTRNQFIGLQGEPYKLTQIHYGAADVEYLIKIRELQRKKYLEMEYKPTVDLENKVVLAFADMEYNGIGLNVNAWNALAHKASGDKRDYADKLDEYVMNDPRLSSCIARTVQTDLFVPAEELRKVATNWDSPKQVLKAFQHLDPKLESVDGKDLIKRADKFPIFRDYVRYKEIAKRATSYGSDFVKQHLGVDGRIHTSFRQILNTGRVSSQEPNMQQIPGSNDYRNCFVPGIPDWVFVSSDYSSQELCIIAVKSQDPVWLNALSHGQDLHSVAAELVFKDRWKEAALEDCLFYKEDKKKCDCPEHGKLRTFVKTINFGLAYGMSAFKLSWTLQISVEEAEELISEYFSQFPAIKDFLEKLANYGKTKGYIKTFRPYLRRRYFPNHDLARSMLQRGDNSGKKIMGEIARASMNTPIQGAGADMTKQALVFLRSYLRENPSFPAMLVMAVHDQVDTICHESVAEQWSKIVTECLERAAKIVLPSGLLKADTQISPVWKK